MSTVEELQQSTADKMQKAIEATQRDMAQIRTGRANPSLLDRVTIDYYGTPSPVAQVANISVQGGQTIIIQPYEKSLLNEIEKSIAKSGLNLPVNNDGTVIRINIPPLTEDTRKEMAKEVKKMGEEGKVTIRNIRRDSSNALDKLQKEENMPEDALKGYHDDIQKLTDDHNAKLEKVVAAKEADLLSI